MAYSDIENDYNSDSYNDDFTTRDEVINDLKKLSNKNDIKAIRQYININRRKLDDYKARLLNDVVNVKGYKFLRRDGKLIITKISPSSKYYKSENSKDNKSEYVNNNEIDGIASTAEFEGFGEVMPTSNRQINESIQAPIRNENIQPKQAINDLQPKQTNDSSLNEPVNADSMVSANSDMATSINSFLLPKNSKPTDNTDISKLTNKAVNETPETMPQFDNLNFNPELTKLLNSIYKQANEQNENQRTQ